MSTTISDNWPSIEELEAQERDLVLERADLASLHDLGRLMSTAAEERELPILIQIRAGARLVYVAALPGSTASNDQWAARKARLTEHFEQSSLLVRLRHERDGQDVHQCAHAVARSLPGPRWRIPAARTWRGGHRLGRGLGSTADRGPRICGRAAQAVPREALNGSVEQLPDPYDDRDAQPDRHALRPRGPTSAPPGVLSRHPAQRAAGAAARRRVRQRDRRLAVHRRPARRDLSRDRRSDRARAVRRGARDPVHRPVGSCRDRGRPLRPAARAARDRPRARRMHGRDDVRARHRRPDRGADRPLDPGGLLLDVLLPGDRRVRPEPRQGRTTARSGQQRVCQPRQPGLRRGPGPRRHPRGHRRDEPRVCHQRADVPRHRLDPVGPAAVLER